MVESVIAGVEVAVATVPAKPFADVTLTVVTVPLPDGEFQVPSPRRYVALDGVPVTAPGRAVTLEMSVPELGAASPAANSVPEVLFHTGTKPEVDNPGPLTFPPPVSVTQLAAALGPPDCKTWPEVPAAPPTSSCPAVPMPN